MAKTFIWATAFLTLAAPALAQDAPGEAGRYAMTQTPDGFMRLDTRTGAVTLCTAVNGVAACRGAPEERLALEAEISRLAKENADLRQRLAQGGKGSRGLDLPKEEDMDKALNFAEKFIRRMMRIMREEDPNKNL